MDELLKILTLAKPNVDPGVFANAEDLYGQGILDSLDIIIIIDEINVFFGLELSIADFSRDDFRTVDNLYKIIKKHRN